MMNLRALILLYGVALGLGLTACQTQHTITQAIYESPTRFVRLEIDHTVGGDHSHPAYVTTDEMAAILGGLVINEPSKLIPSIPFFSEKDKEPPRHLAFTASEIGFFAPLLVQALKAASPEQVITFYQATQQTTVIRRVTSGGMFVKGDTLHLIISNYRAETHYSPDPGTADTYDDRLMPLRSISPLRVKLDFEPASALVQPPSDTWFGWLFRPNRPELIINLNQIRSLLSNQSRPTN
ncbi:MAG: hypothetical protein NNA20_03520 [Nitrospira sp.]|nr:hypothetical protein [Nitrospira sp.]MCP9441641.1 hypothetical protein [Nitrospira sp.]